MAIDLLKPAGSERPTWPVLSVGFRAFFLAGAVYAVLAMLRWTLALRGVLPLPTHVPAAQWHAHEMLLGFAVAIIAGFLLTAVTNWTGHVTARGRPLMALVVLWLAGRILMWLDVSPLFVALVDLAFLPALAVAVGRALIASGKRKNLVMLVVLTALWATNIAFHLAANDVLVLDAAARAMRACMDIVLLLIAIIAGRILPGFTHNATHVAVRRRPLWDRLAIVFLFALVWTDVFQAPPVVVAVASGCAGVAMIVRALGWGALASLRVPILSTLHAGYLLVSIGLVVRALSLSQPPVAASAWYHVLAVGGVGGTILAMMGRVALGHTGRPLRFGRLTNVAFASLGVALLARVLGPALMPSAYTPSLDLAATGWIIAFVLYLVGYAKILVTPRPDSRQG